MKKNVLLITALIIFCAARATVHIVQVSNYQFNPSTVNASVGDTIHWVWVNGFHTTTSTTIPSGAASWSGPLQGAGQTFDYVPTITGTYHYWCAIHTTQMEAVINVTGTMPVILENFTIAPDAKNALISWQTLTEQNTAYFSVRKSYDANNFTEIAKINAAGNSASEHSYSYIDEGVNKAAQYVYYMLAIVDKDGSQQFSDIKMFKNGTAAAKLITQISPNPVSMNGHLMLQFNADKPGQMLVQVYNMSGKIVMQENMDALPGLNNGHLHVGMLSAGSYSIVFTLNDLKETYQVIVQ